MKLSTILLSAQLLYAVLQAVSSVEWTHHTVLDGGGRYHLYWRPPEDKEGDSEIIFRVEVQAKGYVGFGLSPDGGMDGSDIVTGWVMEDGKIFFQHRHGIGNRMPIRDEKQDWILMEATESETHTCLQFRRKLNTCDEKDMVIDDSTMRVIYAFSDRDPDGEDPIYHSRNRGWKSVMLLQSRSNTRPIPDEESLLQWDVRLHNFDASGRDTTYWCVIFRSPPISTKHHVVKIEPLIQEGHEPFIHHMLLYECLGGTPEEFEALLNTSGYECFHPNMPEAMKRCEGSILPWDFGGAGIVFPEHVGLPLYPTPEKYYMLEIHYNNPQLIERLIDNSGLRIYYTPHLRQYDAGVLFIGSVISPRMLVPPGQEKYVVNGHTSPDCLDPAMPNFGIRVLGVLLHAHLLGRSIKTRHFRGNKELPPLVVDKNYDPYYQDYRYYKEEVIILPGDQITTECTYNSLGRQVVTFGGLSTRDEMCFSLLLYYPRIERFQSISIPTLSTINEALKTNIKDEMSVFSLESYNWTNVDIKELSRTLMNSRHEVECYLGNGVRDGVKSLMSYPENLQPFVQIDRTCAKYSEY